jgi:hypothetical protein
MIQGAVRAFYKEVKTALTPGAGARSCSRSNLPAERVPVRPGDPVIHSSYILNGAVRAAYEDGGCNTRYIRVNLARNGGV